MQTACRTGQGQQRTGQALLDNCGIVLQVVQCGLLSEVSLTSDQPRSITVSSLVGCESVEGGATPDAESPVCEENRQGQRKGTCHYCMRLTLQETTPHSAAREQVDLTYNRLEDYHHALNKVIT